MPPPVDDADGLFRRVLWHLHAHGLPEEIEAHVGQGPVVYAAFDMTRAFGRERRMGLEIDLTPHWMRMPPVTYVSLEEDAVDDGRMSRALAAVTARWSKEWSPAISPPAMLLTLFVDIYREIEIDQGNDEIESTPRCEE